MGNLTKLAQAVSPSCFRHLCLPLVSTRHTLCGHPAATMAETSLGVSIYIAQWHGILPAAGEAGFCSMASFQPTNLFILSFTIGLAPILISSQAQASKLPPSAEGDLEGMCAKNHPCCSLRRRNFLSV